MDRVNVPNDLSGVQPDQLNDLKTQLESLAAKYVRNGTENLSDEDVAKIEATADDLDRVSAEIANRTAEDQARMDRAGKALGRLGQPDEEQTEETPTEAPASAEPAAPAAAPVAAEPEHTHEAPAEPVVAEEEQEEEEEVDPNLVPIAASAGTVRTKEGRVVGRQLSDGLARRSPARTAPKRTEEQGLMTATAHAAGTHSFTPNQQLKGVAEIAKLITEKRHRFGIVPSNTREYLPVATGHKEMGLTIGADPGDNYGTIEQARRTHLEVSKQGFTNEALVASGGCCAPYTPLYDFFRTAEPSNEIEDSLPTVEAPRGGIRYIGCTDWRAAEGGVGTYTCEDGVQTDPMVEKPCIHVECPPIEEAEVFAVTQCVSFDNLQYRVFPEQVEAFLADLAVVQSQAKENAYLAAFNADSTPVTGSSTYGMYRAVLDLVTRAAVRYRARAAMNVDANLIVYLPSWVRDGMAIDLINDGDAGTQNWDLAGSQVDSMFSRRDLSVTWYRDLNNAVGGPAQAQSSGTLLAWPEIANAYIHAPGTFVKLDGGSLDVGLIRDSVLNRTNDLEIFMEEWIGVAMVGCESIRLTMELCPSGARPNYVTAYTC